MGFDKTKIVRAAEKFLAQGKIPAAIKEYQQIIEHDPEDFTTLNMLGDLYVRIGKKREATACFARIAEHYREQGFALKAIAMYKKIDRLDPGSPEIAYHLATLYQMQGLVVDARAQYLIVADAFTRAGQAEKALEILRKIADLDPHNTDIRLKLAEGYLREGLRGKAAEAFSKAGEQFIARGAHERALEAYTRALAISPRDQSALNGLLTAHIERGTADDAAEILEQAVAEQPSDANLLSMLARAYVEAEDAPAAERVTAALVAQEPTSYMRLAEVVRLYLKAGDVQRAVNALGGIVEQMLAGREEDELVALLNEVLARDPEQIDGLRMLVRLHWWQRDNEKLRSALERMVEAAAHAGLVDEERYALTHLVRLVPDQPEYAERLRELGGPEAIEEEEGVTVPEPDSGEVPTFESFTLTSESTQAAGGATGGYAGGVEFETNTVASQPLDPAASFADLNDSWAAGADAAGAADFAGPSAHQPPSGFQEFDFGSVMTDSPSTSSDAGGTAGATSSDPRREAMWRQELESVDFYIAQGYTDIALDTLNMLERQFGAQAEIDARRKRLQAASPSSVPPSPPAPGETSEFEGFIMEETSPAPVAPQQTAPPKDAIDPGLAAIFEEFRAAAEDEEPAASADDYETHYNLGLAYKEMDLVDEAVEEFQIAVGLVAPQDGTPRYLQCCNLLGHCFMQKGMPRLAVMWFKKGLEAPGHTEDEYQALRYEMGTAYEQAGDLDQAIEVFTEVYGINVSYRGVADKLRDLQAQRAAR